MKLDRSWAHCPLCPDTVWTPLSEMVEFKRPVLIHNQKVYYVCQAHAKALYERLKKSRGRSKQ